MPTITKPIISLDDLKVQLPIRQGNAEFDARLLSLIDVATAQIETATRRNFTKQAYVERFNTSLNTKRVLDLLGTDTYSSRGFHDAGSIRVSRDQIITLTAPVVDLAVPVVVEYDPVRKFTLAESLSFVVVDALNFTVDADEGRIFLRHPTARGFQYLRVTYTGGFALPVQGVTPTTLDPNNKDASITLSNGNLTAATTGAGVGSAFTISKLAAGKFMIEFKIDVSSSSPTDLVVGFAKTSAGTGVAIGEGADSFGYRGDGNARTGAADVAGVTADTFAAGDTITLFLDLDNGAAWFAKNGVLQNGATQAEIDAGTTTNAFFTALSGTFMLGVGDGDGVENGTITVNFGASSFSASLPAGFASGFGELDNSNQNLSASAPTDLKQAAIVQAMFLFKKFDAENVGSRRDKKQGGAALLFPSIGGLTPEAASLVTRYKKLIKGSS